MKLALVTCYRHWEMFLLQAQSLYHYLDPDIELHVTVLEPDPEPWHLLYQQQAHKWLHNRRVHIYWPQDWNVEPYYLWNLRRRRSHEYWAHAQRQEGWYNQQLYKLVMVHELGGRVLVLDTQNFLIKSWDPTCGVERVPYRAGAWAMPTETWWGYGTEFVMGREPNPRDMAIATPIFMHGDIVRNLVAYVGGLGPGALKTFSKWFNSRPYPPSEFTLYYIYSIVTRLFGRYYERAHDWAAYYLRDGADFEQSLAQLAHMLDINDQIPHHCWVSINHRAWQDMTDDQYAWVCERLSKFNLQIDMSCLRAAK